MLPIARTTRGLRRPSLDARTRAAIRPPVVKEISTFGRNIARANRRNSTTLPTSPHEKAGEQARKEYMVRSFLTDRFLAHDSLIFRPLGLLTHDSYGIGRRFYSSIPEGV